MIFLSQMSKFGISLQSQLRTQINSSRETKAIHTQLSRHKKTPVPEFFHQVSTTLTIKKRTNTATQDTTTNRDDIKSIQINTLRVNKIL